MSGGRGGECSLSGRIQKTPNPEGESRRALLPSRSPLSLVNLSSQPSEAGTKRFRGPPDH
jgi:hypothetical protein